jgi:hypothetical protein
VRSEGGEERGKTGAVARFKLNKTVSADPWQFIQVVDSEGGVGVGEEVSSVTSAATFTGHSINY